MKKALLGALIGLVVIINCAKDIYVPPASPVAGVYRGEYKVVRQTESGPQTKRVRIKWTFTDQKYWIDSSLIIQGQSFCESNGNYEISSAIDLDSTEVQTVTCDKRDIPIGEFSFQRLNTAEGRDSLYLVQIVIGDTGWTKEAFLLKDTAVPLP